MTTNDISNPLQFKLKETKKQPIENSPLIRIALAFNSGQYYAAAVDPTTKKNYVLHVNIIQQGQTGFKEIYKDIENEHELTCAGIFFNKCGVFELYYKGQNWDFGAIPVPAKDAGTKTDSFGRKNKYEKQGISKIPPWFSKKFTPEGFE
jgi:hypothetical protein